MFADGGEGKSDNLFIYTFYFFRAQHSYSDGRKRNDRDACRIVWVIFFSSSSITILSTSNIGRDKKKVGVARRVKEMNRSNTHTRHSIIFPARIRISNRLFGVRAA